MPHNGFQQLKTKNIDFLEVEETIDPKDKFPNQGITETPI